MFVLGRLVFPRFWPKKKELFSRNKRPKSTSKWKIRPLATFITGRYSILYFLDQITIKADSKPIFIIQYTGNNAIEIRVSHSQRCEVITLWKNYLIIQPGKSFH